MPIINGMQPHTGPVTPDSIREALRLQGPMIPIEVSVPDALALALTASGVIVPQPIIGNALIDTGATITSIDDGIMQRLGIAPINRIHLGSAAGLNNHNVYPAKISFPGVGGITLFYSVVGVHLTGQISNGLPLIGLIGRDLLSSCVLVYNGTTGMFTLAFA